VLFFAELFLVVALVADLFFTARFLEELLAPARPALDFPAADFFAAPFLPLEVCFFDEVFEERLLLAFADFLLAFFVAIFERSPVNST
jgi:hypothetical protein